MDAVKNTQKQLDTQFVMGFCSIVAYDSHVHVLPHRSNQVVQMVFCPYPDGEVKYTLPIKPNATHFVTVAYSNGHFAVLQFDIKNQHVSVYDGLNYSIKNWQNHVIQTIKTYGLRPIGAKTQSQYTEEM